MHYLTYVRLFLEAQLNQTLIVLKVEFPLAPR